MEDYCPLCIGPKKENKHAEVMFSEKYPQYWKQLPAGWRAIDTYRVNQLFPVADPSGMLLHARKKLLVPGVRTGGKSLRKDVLEARDTLNRWLEDNPEE